MLTVRRADERGHANHGWLDTWHTFSFADYYDPAHMNFHSLRVINEDRVEAGHGFPMHPHRDMEILTYVLEGSLEHQDSMGNGSVIRPGDVQYMCAGKGVTHSEFNPSDDESVHLLQIWILPNQKGLAPSYDQKQFPPEARSGRLCRIASGDGRDDSIRIHQDVDLYASLLKDGDSIDHPLKAGRHAWVQVARGSLYLNDVHLNPGDGAAVSGESVLQIDRANDAEILIFDLS